MEIQVCYSNQKYYIRRKCLVLKKYKNIFSHEKLNQLTSHIFIEEDIDALIICAMDKFMIDYLLKNYFLNIKISRE